MRKPKFYFVELCKGRERRLAYLANSKAEAALYARVSNRLFKKSGWKAFVMPLAKLLYYFDSPEKANRKVVKA
jgi:hypothetical protein